MVKTSPEVPKEEQGINIKGVGGN